MRAARVLLAALIALLFAISAGYALDRAIIGESDRALQQLAPAEGQGSDE